MTILSLILITFTSLISATGTILAISGGLAGSSLVRSVLAYSYNLLLPAALVLFIVSFAYKNKNKKHPRALALAFGLSALQTVITAVIYQLNLSGITATENRSLNLLPLIVEVIAIIGTFVGAVIAAIKSTGEKFEYSEKPKLLAWTALGLGILELLWFAIPTILLRINVNNPVSQPLLQWTTWLSPLQTALFALAVLNTARKPDKYTVLSWLGVLLAFSATPALYLIAYL